MFDSNLNCSHKTNFLADFLISHSHGDVVVIQVESDQLVQRPQRGRGDRVELAVGDGQILEVAWIIFTHYKSSMLEISANLILRSIC